MRTTFLLFFHILLYSAILGQENLYYPLFNLLPQFQNPAAVAQQRIPVLNASFGDYGLQTSKNYFLSYEQPLKKVKGGIGGSYFISQNHLSNLQRGSIAFNKGAEISAQSYLKIGVQFSFFNKKSFFGRIDQSVSTPMNTDPNFPKTTMTDFDVDLDFGIWYQYKKLDIGLSYRHALAPAFEYGEYFDLFSGPLYFLHTAYRIDVSDEFKILTASNIVLGDRQNFIADISGTFYINNTFFVGVNLLPIETEDFSQFGLNLGARFWKIKAHFYHMPKTNDTFGTTLQLLIQYNFTED